MLQLMINSPSGTTCLSKMVKILFYVWSKNPFFAIFSYFFKQSCQGFLLKRKYFLILQPILHYLFKISRANSVDFRKKRFFGQSREDLRSPDHPPDLQKRVIKGDE